MSNDSRLKEVEKIMEHSDGMKPTRFWGLWIIGVLVALSLVLPQLLVWAKALGWVE